MSDVLATADSLMHLAAAVAYAAAFVTLMFATVLGKGSLRTSAVTGAVALGLHVAAIAARWIAVGHGPVVTKYENLSAYALVTAAVALYLLLRKHSLGVIGLVLYPTSFLLIGLGLYSGPAVENLPPTFTGVWLVLHVCLYFLAFGTAVTAVGASVLHLVHGRLRPDTADRLPTAAELDAMAYRYAGLGFAFWGVGMLTGAIWAFNAWGRYWGWDPVETWSLITWLSFGIYLHLRRFYAWEGSRAAWLIIVTFGFALMSLFGTTLIDSSLHAVYFR